MSAWEETCKELLTRYPSLNALCITDLEGNIWGSSSPSFSPPSDLIKKAVAAINGQSSLSSLEVCGTKYIVIRNESNSIISKAGKKSCFLTKTTQMCIMGLAEDTESSMHTANANLSMSRIAEYYISVGF
ncbi:hypothetical protein Ciccas_010092 [Cichlidogyrus casuarinus]|uniref:Profilin n=1 Tax=Cichlidogyrus casuarinus TaxID=1844966 RepID=A0ABD2PV40_9PLAT